MVKLKKWALILTCTAFLFFTSHIVRGSSYEMYDLENINPVSNLYSKVTTGTSYFSSDTWQINSGHIYTNHKLYFSWQHTNTQNETVGLYLVSSPTLANSSPSGQIAENTNNSFIVNMQDYEGFNFYRGGLTITPPTTLYIYDLIIIDLSQTFGFGKEPSLSDFESLYLANIPEYQNTGYFQEYSSYIPESYITIDQTSYINLVEDLTDIDYTKSVISNYGDNITIDMYAIVDQRINLTYDWLNIDHYINYNFPELKYLGNLYQLNWERVDYSDHVIHLVMNDIEQDIFKRILFNRNIDFTDEYFHLKVEASAYTQVSLWFEISTAFNLKVGIKSILLARDTDTLNDFNMVNSIYYKFIDISGDLMLPALKVNIGDVQRTTYMDDFGSQYSDISEFIIAFDVASPSDLAPYPYEDHYLYELGLFSSNNVFIPSEISDSELDSLFPNDVCDWFQFGCHVNNIVNNIGSTLYTKLNIPAISAVFNDIIASVTNIAALTPEPVKIVIYVILGALGTGFIFLLVERIL